MRAIYFYFDCYATLTTTFSITFVSGILQAAKPTIIIVSSIPISTFYEWMNKNHVIKI